MTKTSPSLLIALSVLLAAGCAATDTAPVAPEPGPDSAPAPADPSAMDMGAFSVSLSVADLSASRAFYESLGFSSLGGDESRNYLIMKNGGTVIGLFKGMFEGNILTFNPGWDSSAQEVDPFTDVRELERRLVAAGIQPVTSIPDEVAAAEGPASFVIVDPDGNTILVDQHR